MTRKERSKVRTEDWEELSDSSRSVGDDRLPDVDRSLSDTTSPILSDDVDSSEDSCETLLAEDIGEDLLRVGRDAGVVCILVAIVVFVGLPTDSSDVEEELSDELHGTVDVGASVAIERRERWNSPLSNSPALVEETELELRKEEIDGLSAVVGDNHTTRTHRRLAHVVGLVGQSTENGLDDASEVGGEAVSKRGGEEDEEGDVSLSDVGAGAPGAGKDGREETLESVGSKTREDLRDSLGGSLLVDSTRWRLEDSHERVHEAGEVVLAQAFDECSEGFGGGRSSFGDRVDEDSSDERYELREVGDEVLGFGERCHVPDDGGGLALDVGTSLSQPSIQDGDDLEDIASVLSEGRGGRDVRERGRTNR